MSDPQPEIQSPPADTPTDPVDSAVVALARSVERTGRRVEALDTLVAQLAADLTTLARALAARTRPGDAPPDAGEGPPAVRSWLLVDDPDQALADLADLAAWMDEVFLRYRDAQVPPCWLWHPEVIEELWWLYQAHADAYHPETGTWARVGDWHDRQRPGVVRRLRAVAGCELALHLTDPTNPAWLSGTASHVGPPPPAPCTDAVAAVAAAWVGHRGQPEPEPAQLTESHRYGRTSIGGRR